VAELTGQAPPLDEAVELGAESVRLLPEGHPSRVERLVNLAVALQVRYDHAGRPGDLERAIAALRRALADVPETHLHRLPALANLGVAVQARF